MQNIKINNTTINIGTMLQQTQSRDNNVQRQVFNHAESFGAKR